MGAAGATGPRATLGASRAGLARGARGLPCFAVTWMVGSLVLVDGVAGVASDGDDCAGAVCAAAGAQRYGSNNDTDANSRNAIETSELDAPGQFSHLGTMQRRV